MVELVLMCGAPGSGKSTFIKEHMTEYNRVSRDQIRFELVPEGEDYFSKEDEVMERYIHDLADSLAAGKNTVADSTNLSPKVRRRLIEAIRKEFSEFVVSYYCFECGLEETLRRNSLRTGRECVPESGLRTAYKAYKRPTYEEEENVSVIVVINEKGDMRVV